MSNYTVITTHANGMPKFIQIEGDVKLYEMVPHQKFVPKCIADPFHPVSVGDTLSPLDRVLPFPVSAVFVSGVRTIKINKGSLARRQVEILGRPCVWHDITLFREYTGVKGVQRTKGLSRYYYA